MRREQVKIGRKQISYLTSAPPAPATRQHPLRTVLFLHAFPLQAAMWEPNLGALPEGWRGIAPDLRGFGESPLPDSDKHRISEFAGDVIDLLDRLEISEAVCVGCSMGGYVLFEMIRTAPQYAAGAVLVSTRAGADSDEGKANRRKMIERLESGGVAAIASEMVPKLIGATSQRERPDLERQVRNLILGNPPEAIKTAITAMMERADSTPLLAKIKVPALIIAGAEDTLIPPSQAEEMHRAIPGSAWKILANGGHLLNLEQTTSFEALLYQYLQAL
jgi:3-oxoadipate enol-lactonase